MTLLNGDTFGSVEQAMLLPTALRELSDWLRKEHYDVIMPPILLQRDRIGQSIRSLRTQRDMTQQELADAAGITRANVCNIESGKYSVGLDVLNKIANAIGVKVELK